MRDSNLVTPTKVFAIVFAILMVSSSSVGVVAADGVTLDDYDDEDVEAADEIYVGEDGAVLVYEEDDYDESEFNELNFGADVSTGLVNAFFEYEDSAAEDIDGDVGVTVEQDSISGSSDLTVDPDEQFDDFTFTATGEHTQANSEFNAETYVEFTDTAQIPVVTTTGEVVVGPDSFESDMSFSVYDEYSGTADSPQIEEYRLEQTGDGYELTVREEGPISPFTADRWDTEADAQQTLEQQAEGLANELDATATVTIESYDYTESDGDAAPELDIQYNIELTGVGDSVGDLVAEGLADDPAVDMTAEEIDAVSDAVNDLEINYVTVETMTDGSTTEVDASVSFENYETATLTYMDAVADEDEDALVTPERVDEFETVTEARADADMTQTITWDGEIEPTADGGVLTADVAYETENWDAYVSELADRGVDHDTDATFNVDIAGNGDELDVNATFDVNRDDLVDEAITGALDEYRDDPSVSDEDFAFLEAFDDSDVQVMKSDIVFGEDTVEVRAAGQFDNLTEFTSASTDFPDDAPVTHMYGHETNDTVETYVTVDIDADAEEFRSSAFADDDTEVHAAGEWDREFPEMDTEDVANYLGVDLSDDDDASDDSIPGFGAVVAVIALLAAALVASRRHGQ